MHDLDVSVTDLFVVIVNWNTAEILKECLNSIRHSTHRITYSICVVDNGSTDGSVKMVSEHFPEVLLISNKINLGFAKANNQGFSIANGRYVLLLNSDTVIPNGALDRLVAFADKFGGRFGVLAPRLKGADGDIQNSIGPFPSFFKSFITRLPFSEYILPKKIVDHYLIRSEKCDYSCEVDYAEGACLFVRKEVIDQVGGLDEDYFMYGEDIDWCHRMHKAGWKIVYLPDIRIIHLVNSSGDKKFGGSRMVAIRLAKLLFYRKSYGSFYAFIYRVIMIIRSFILRYYYKVLIITDLRSNKTIDYRKMSETYNLMLVAFAKNLSIQDLPRI